MKLTLLKKEKEKMVFDVAGGNHTFLNLLRENAWKAGGSQVSYMIEHPHLSAPKLIVTAKNPKKTLENAAQMIISQAKDFEKELKRVSKK